MLTETHNHHSTSCSFAGLIWHSFNGKEQDYEWNGTTCGSYDYGYRIYDARICRFPLPDLLTKKYPDLTPYQFASNSPIFAIDVDGLESLDYKILGYLSDGTAKVYITRTQNTTSRTNGTFALVVNNVTPTVNGTVGIRFFNSPLLNQVFGINTTNLTAPTTSIKEGVSTNFKNTTVGSSDYYFKIAATDLQSTGVQVNKPPIAEGQYFPSQDALGNYEGSEFYLLVPPNPAPQDERAINLAPPDAGGSANNFINTVITEVNQQVTSTLNQPNNQVTQISITYPDIPAYTNVINTLTQQLTATYPNVTINTAVAPIVSSGNQSVDVKTVGSSVPFQ